MQYKIKIALAAVAACAGIALSATQAYAGLTLGATSVDSSAALTLGGTSATSIAIGHASATTTITGGILLQNAESITNNTDGIVAVGGDLAVNGVRIDNASAATAGDVVESFALISGNIAGVGNVVTGKKGTTYGLKMSMDRPLGTNTTVAGSEDTAIKVNTTNYAAANAASYTFRGMDINTRNRNTGNVNSLQGAYITAENRDGTTGAVVDVIGVYANAKQGGSNFSGEVIGLKVENQSPSALGSSYGIVVTESAEGTAVTKNAAIRIQAGPGGWQYGLDANSATTTVADIRLHNGALIDNNTSGVLTLTVATTTLSGELRLQNGATIANSSNGVTTIRGNGTNGNDLLTVYGNLKIVNATTTVVTGIDPGSQVKLMYEFTEAATSSPQGMQISAVNGTASTNGGGVTGLEVKAKSKSGVTGTLNTIRGIVSTADARNRTVTTMKGAEIQVSGSSGANVTTAMALNVVTQFNVTGTYGSIYGISIQADDVANTADIQLSGGSGAASGKIRPTIGSGSGIPDNGACTPDANLGSLYINTAGTAAAHTLLYVCTESGNWVAVASTTGF